MQSSPLNPIPLNESPKSSGSPKLDSNLRSFNIGIKTDSRISSPGSSNLLPIVTPHEYGS